MCGVKITTVHLHKQWQINVKNSNLIDKKIIIIMFHSMITKLNYHNN